MTILFNPHHRSTELPRTPADEALDDDEIYTAYWRHALTWSKGASQDITGVHTFMWSDRSNFAMTSVHEAHNGFMWERRYVIAIEDSFICGELHLVFHVLVPFASASSDRGRRTFFPHAHRLDAIASSLRQTHSSYREAVNFVGAHLYLGLAFVAVTTSLRYWAIVALLQSVTGICAANLLRILLSSATRRELYADLLARERNSGQLGRRGLVAIGVAASNVVSTCLRGWLAFSVYLVFAVVLFALAKTDILGIGYWLSAGCAMSAYRLRSYRHPSDSRPVTRQDGRERAADFMK